MTAQTAPFLTRVSGIMYRADGVPAHGDLIITWPAFTTADQGAVQAGKKVVTLGAGGQIDVGLFPTVGAAPSDTLYRVVLKATDGTTAVEYWSVPAIPTTTVSAMRVNAPSISASSSAVLQTAISGKLGRQGDTPVTMAGIRFASEFQGATPSDKINSAVTDCKDAQCVVIIPSGMTAGMPPKIGDNTKIIDFRGNGEFRKDIGIFSRWTKVGSGLQLVDNLHLNTDAYRGGHNLWPGDTKTQYASLWLTGRYRTIGERKDITQDVQCLGKGDCVGIATFVRDWGGYGTGGDEGHAGLRVAAEQGMENYFPQGTVTATSGNRVTANWNGTNAYLGEQRPLINVSRGVYSTGTLSSATGATPCVITGNATGWTALGPGPHADLFMEIVPLSNSTYGLKYVLPVISITDDTHLVVEYFQVGSAAACIGTGLTAGSAYKIFKGGNVNSLDDPTSSPDPTTANLAVPASMFQVGDSVQQPLGYNSMTVGMNIYVDHRIGPPSNSGYGVMIQNASLQLESGLRIFGNFLYGIRFANNVGGTLISSSGSPVNLIDDSGDTTSSTTNLFVLKTPAGALRTLSYSRQYDQFNFPGGFNLDAGNGHIGQTVAPDSAQMQTMYWTSPDVGGLRIEGAPGLTRNLLQVGIGFGKIRFRVADTAAEYGNGLSVSGLNSSDTKTWSIDSSNGQAWFAKVCYNSSKTVCDYAGTGAPSGTCGTGSTYRRTDGGANSTFYVCENSSWTAK